MKGSPLNMNQNGKSKKKTPHQHEQLENHTFSNVLSPSNSVEQTGNVLEQFAHQNLMQEENPVASLTLKEEGGGEKDLIKGMMIMEAPAPAGNRPQTRGRSSPSGRNTRGQSRGHNKNQQEHQQKAPGQVEEDEFAMPNQNSLMSPS